jgi:DNA-binding transcriptional MocR family regulator
VSAERTKAERAAADAERERLLDLLEKAYHSLDACESIPKGGYALWLELKNQLREYGRLGKEES